MLARTLAKNAHLRGKTYGLQELLYQQELL